MLITPSCCIVDVTRCSQIFAQNRDFCLPHLHLTTPLVGGFPSEYCHDVWDGKIIMMWLPDGEKRLKTRFLVLTEFTNVTDGRTTHDDTGRACIAQGLRQFILNFCRAMLCKRGLCRHAVCVCLCVCVCLSVCPSRSYILSKRTNKSSKCLHHCCIKRDGDIPTGTSLTRASKAGGVGKKSRL